MRVVRRDRITVAKRMVYFDYDESIRLDSEHLNRHCGLELEDLRETIFLGDRVPVGNFERKWEVTWGGDKSRRTETIFVRVKEIYRDDR